MSRPLSKDNLSVIKAVELVEKFNDVGITIHEICAHCGWSLAHTKNIMTAASALGLAASVYTQNRMSLWFTPKRAEWFKRISTKTSEALRAQRAAESFRIRASRAADAPVVEVDPYLLRELSDTPTRRVVLAASAPPVVTAGVRSIFDLVSA